MFGAQNNSEKSRLGIWFCYYAKLERHFANVFLTNMAVSSCEWKPWIQIDAFSLNWKGENNWVVPPPSQIVRAWKHFQICKARGVLIIPLWKGAVFWPCVCPDGIHLAKCVTDWVALPKFNSPASVKGRAYNSMFYGQPLSFKLIAVYVNWQNFHERRRDRGFCL